MKVGTIVNGRFDGIPASAYEGLGTQLQFGQVYEVRMETAPMTPEKEAENIRSLNNLSIQGFTVLGIEAKGNTIRLQGQRTSTVLGITIAALVTFIGAIIWPLISLAIGAIFIQRIGEITWAVILISGIGIFAYLIFKTGKKKKPE